MFFGSFGSFASYAIPSLRSALGVPPTKLPIDGITFVSYVLPPLVLHFAIALLAVKPRTRTARLALWPLVALLALRAALSVNVSLGETEYRFHTSNFALLMLSITVRSLGWAMEKGPLVRYLRPGNNAPSTIIDALDLACSFRGHGWNFSDYRSYIPRETRPENRMAFLVYTLLFAVMHALICGTFHRAILTVLPVGSGPIPDVSTIFDDTLPFLTRYLRSTVITIMTATMIHSMIQMVHNLCTIIAILALGQDPGQWPPVFDAPWRATSLSDFWGRRWHQLFRRTFLLGGYPLSFVFGRAGIVIGTFLASGLWHYVTVVTLNPQVEPRWMFVGFGVMGAGILAERAFGRLTGRRVGGVWGWMWTMAWLLVWGNLIAEGFARGWILGSSNPLDSATPLRPLVERLMIDFEVWLHTM